jgi:large repetitive protein
MALALALSVSVASAAAGPGAPTGLGATPGDGQVTLTWQPPSDIGGSPIGFYTVSASPGSFQRNTPDAATTTMTVPGLTNGTQYTFSVTATNSAGAGPAATVSATPQAPTPTPSPSPSASPVPTPTPVNAFLTLDLSAGGPNTQINVSGNSFLPGEQMSLFWDTPSKVIGAATADGNGNFSNVKVKPFAGDASGLHKICASVQPVPCAQFELQATPTPTPSPAASPSESPSPVESPSPSPSDSPTPGAVPLPVANNTNNLDVLFHPPFIFLPFIAALGLIGAIAYWVFGTVSRRPRAPLPSASIVHRSVRPEAGMPGYELAPTAFAAPLPPPAPEPLPPLDAQPPWPSPKPPIPDDEPDSTQPRD